ncbi:MAG: hypothetical protein ACRCZI_09900 [Cetobacterium sp.]
MFRIASNEKEFVVSVEQAGPDVVIRLNGMGVVTCQANVGLSLGPEVVVFRTAAQEVGVTVRVEGVL